MKIQGYGWRKDSLDHRDIIYRAAKPIPLPKVVDLRPQMPAVYNQGALGSCTANAIAAALHFDLMKQNPGIDTFVPSRLFIYYNERALEGSVESDSGAELRDGCKTVGLKGVCPEIQWPYEPANFAVVPEKVCYTEARLDLAKNYYRVQQTKRAIQTCLAEGYPFVFGFSVFESFETDEVARTGIVPMPQRGEALVGGHAVLAVGYDNGKEQLIVRNSWSDGWGLSGYFMMPFAYVLNANLASDFWTLRKYTL